MSIFIESVIISCEECKQELHLAIIECIPFLDFPRIASTIKSKRWHASDDCKYILCPECRYIHIISFD